MGLSHTDASLGGTSASSLDINLTLAEADLEKDALFVTGRDSIEATSQM